MLFPNYRFILLFMSDLPIIDLDYTKIKIKNKYKTKI